MYDYENLILIGEDQGMSTEELELIGDCGYYCDGTAFISSNSINTVKYGVLAEEIGHHETSFGIIINNSLISLKQERIARARGYSYTASPDKIVKALLNYCATSQELAEYLGVPDEYLHSAIEYYKQKYGAFYKCKDYILYFEPLSVCGSDKGGSF